MATDRWTDDRLDDAFRDLRRSVDELGEDVRVFAPLVGDVHGLAAKYSAMQKNLDRVEEAIKPYINRSITRQLVIVSTPMFVGVVGVLIAFFSGKVG